MLKDKEESIVNNKDERNLSEVFKELQQIRYTQQEAQVKNTSAKARKKTTKPTKKKTKVVMASEETSFHQNKKSVRLSNLIIILSVLILIIIAAFPKDVFSKESATNETEENKKEKVETAAIPSDFEINRRALNMQKIISENSSFEKVKEQVSEDRNIDFEIKSQANATLPRGEQIVLQKGALGKESVSLVKTYENGEFIEEIILEKHTTQEPVPEILDIGTSDFLAKLKIHLGDIVYLTADTSLRKEANDNSEEVAKIKQSLDVKLLELPNEEWCKVSFDNIEGYIPTKNLTSAYVTPNIIEKNRIQRILIKVNINMELNKSTGLTLKDYQKIFKGIPNDKNKIFESNAEVFYNVDKKYNVNGLFIASIAIHESAWGTSQIAQEKHNLFGYGSYDQTPYESSYDFTTYEEGIETVSKSLVKYYLNPSGTKIYGGETASAWYYNGPTLEGVNQRYASDPDWHKKVFSYMEMLYNRLK